MDLPGTELVTEGGRVNGVGNDQQVVRWLDIPYAQPPVGDLRWLAPRSLVASCIRVIAHAEPVLCPQQASQTAGLEGDEIVGQKDCLHQV